jgi:uncharacterized membrane protein YhaH (DUF805 family)
MTNDGDLRRVLASLFDVRGRLSRVGFYIVFLGWGGYSGIVTAIAGAAALRGDSVGLFMGALLAPALIVTILAMIRRLHDRGRSGWLVALVYVPSALALALIWIAASIDNGALGVVGILAFLASSVPMFWVMIEMFVLRGETGANRFGPDPLAGEMAAQVFDER